MAKCENITRPSNQDVEKKLKDWRKDRIFEFEETDRCLDNLFTRTYPLNKNHQEVLVKIYALNSAYFTQIPSPCFPKLARQIIDIENIDEKLRWGAADVVSDMAKTIEYQNGRGAERRHTPYSFATKYCSFHNPDKYPIFDSNVERALLCYKREYPKFAESVDGIWNTNQDLRHYEAFKKVVDSFKECFSLDRTYREIDKYLYQVGRELK